MVESIPGPTLFDNVLNNKDGRFDAKEVKVISYSPFELVIKQYVQGSMSKSAKDEDGFYTGKILDKVEIWFALILYNYATAQEIQEFSTAGSYTI